VLDELPYTEVAGQLGVPEATVRQRVSRGLARLRTTFE
jgi:DNA-directed RNA polymerase specialized sigma24 family protein